MLALPYTYRHVIAAEGTVIQIIITTNIGDTWFLLQTNNKWQLTMHCSKQADTQLFIEPDIAWKLFSKSIRTELVKDKIVMNGNVILAATALQMVSVIAYGNDRKTTFRLTSFTYHHKKSVFLFKEIHLVSNAYSINF